MNLRSARGAFVAASVLATLSLVLGLTPPAAADAADHCATMLVPIGEPVGDDFSAEPVALGCYATFEEAVEAGSSGTIDLPEGTEPEGLTQATVDASSEFAASSVLIGTEYTQENYAQSSQSYFAPTTCSADTTWEVSYVGNDWNDNFESGRGFGGCDRNRKFRASNFEGDVLVCTPNCSNYGALRNEVSSLRWRA
jgi:hypothetical protein